MTIGEELQKNDELARKIADLIRAGLTKEELDQLPDSDVAWLALQMLCGPRWAARMVQRSSISVERRWS